MIAKRASPSYRGRRPGKLVRYTKKDGGVQMAIAYNDKQHPEFIKAKKVFLNLIDENYNQMVDGGGKNITGLKDISLVTVIGMVD